MTDVIAWLSLYAGFVTLVVVIAHRHEVREHRASHRQSDGARGEVESVPVHATYVTAQEARNHG